MRKRLAVLCVCAGLLIGAGVLWGESDPKSGDTITVQVLSGKVMEKPKFLGRSVAAVSRGDHLTFMAANGAWLQVKAGNGQDGWVHRSAVQLRKVTLSAKPGSSGEQVSEKEQELAARGFSEEVEGEYKTKHPDLDFSHVDNIEKLSSDPEQVGKFASDGKVGAP